MNTEQITTIITAIFQGGGILLFLYYYIRGLKDRVTSLKDTIQAQEKTLSVMEKRITETEKVGNIYKNLIADLPKDLENYRAVISQTKDNVIFELKNMNKEKDEEIKRLRDIETELEKLPKAEVEKRHLLRAFIFLHKPENKDIYDFSAMLLEDQELVIPRLISAKSISELISTMGGNLQIEKESETITNLWKGPEGKFPNGLRSISRSINGNFAIFRDKRVIMDKEKYAFLDFGLKRLREFIQS